MYKFFLISLVYFDRRVEYFFKEQQMERQSNQLHPKDEMHNERLRYDHDELWQKIYTKISEEHRQDLFSRIFLNPIDVKLKPKRDQRTGLPRGLPCGLQQALKLDIDANTYNLQDFPCYDKSLEDYKKVQQINADNMISILKKPNKPIMVAICICMYNEDDLMLRRTLDGIKKNITTFMHKGIRPDQIAVCVIIDGIDVVDSSIPEYFDELQKESGINIKGEDSQIHLQRFLDEIKNVPDEEGINCIPYLIYNEQFEERKKRQFSERKKQYEEVHKRINRIQGLQKDKTITIQSLDFYILPYFLKLAKELHKRNYHQDQDDVNRRQADFYYKKYGEIISVSKPLIRQALGKAKNDCRTYLRMRDDLALMTPFRIDVPLPQGLQQKQDMLENNQFLGPKNSDPKMNLFFFTKYKNSGKISSHNWFFNGLCQELQPKYTILLDVGLVPQQDALFKMVDQMENNTQIGGVCGYMGIRIEKVESGEQISEDNLDCLTSFSLGCFDIQKAQQLQYHFAHLIDKGFESIFNFIHVLPGAFSGYRMKALKPKIKNNLDNSDKSDSNYHIAQQQMQDSQLLTNYFKALNESQQEGSIGQIEFSICQAICSAILPRFLFECIFKKKQKIAEELLYEKNVYLAEDRTLCLGIYTNGYHLKYLPDVYGWIDPMKTLTGLLGQRKRWINGSFFAFSKVKKQISIREPDNCSLKIQVSFLQSMDFFAFISPALFLFTLHTALNVLQNNVIEPFILGKIFKGTTIDNQAATLLVQIGDLTYILTFLGLIWFSMFLNNKNKKFQSYIYGVSTFYGFISIATFIILLFELIYGLINQSSFLIYVPKQLEDFPGAQQLIASVRYVLLIIFGLYAIPITIYLCKFRNRSLLPDILVGFSSFIFYAPTYLVTLQVYALCRIDDISWGTKGRDKQDNRSQNINNSWKKLKILYVAKFLIYNSIVAFILLVANKTYYISFIQAYIFIILLTLSLFIKVFLGTIYNLHYLCCKKQEKKDIFSTQDKVNEKFERVQKSLLNQIKHSIYQIIKQCESTSKNFKIQIKIGERAFKQSPKKNHNRRKNTYNSRISQIQSKLRQ